MGNRPLHSFQTLQFLREHSVGKGAANGGSIVFPQLTVEILGFWVQFVQSFFQGKENPISFLELDFPFSL